MLERTLMFVKPDHYHLYVPILEMVDPLGKRVAEGPVEKVSRDKIAEHYISHQNQRHYLLLVDHFVDRSIFLAVYEGEGIVQKVLDLAGPTDPSKAGKDTVRGRFSDDSLELSRKEGRIVRNVVHRASSSEEAKREIEIWDSYLVWK
ncbi:MAG: nucleoside-diphosphate kinase [Nanoarchaeota archaeon]|nr:nucleoside-diphosphate kinase [Nanoarchaeota archaeon]